jgi:hypothetical protein
MNGMHRHINVADISALIRGAFSALLICSKDWRPAAERLL